MTEPKFVLLTGSSSKLGRPIAEILATKKYNILLHYFKSEKETISLAKTLKYKFSEQDFCPIHIDLTKNNSRRSIKKLIPKSKNIIGIINNASLYFEDSKDNFKFEDYKKNINIHYRNPLTLISLLIENGGVSFAINITDNNLNKDKYFSYSMSKSMLSDYCFENSITSLKNINMVEFKPKKILPSKDPFKNITKFKQEFNKLLK